MSFDAASRRSSVEVEVVKWRSSSKGNGNVITGGWMATATDSAITSEEETNDAVGKSRIIESEERIV